MDSVYIYIYIFDIYIKYIYKIYIYIYIYIRKCNMIFVYIFIYSANQSSTRIMLTRLLWKYICTFNELRKRVIHLIYCVKSQWTSELKLLDLAMYLCTILSRNTYEKYGTQYFFVLQFMDNILMLHKYCVISASDVVKLCSHCIARYISWTSISINILYFQKYWNNLRKM